MFDVIYTGICKKSKPKYTQLHVGKYVQPFQCHLYSHWLKVHIKGRQTQTTKPPNQTHWPDVALAPSFRRCFGRTTHVNPKFGAQAERLWSQMNADEMKGRFRGRSRLTASTQPGTPNLNFKWTKLSEFELSNEHPVEVGKKFAPWLGGWNHITYLSNC